MDSNRRRFLCLGVGAVALWALTGVSAAENPVTDANVVHLTLNVEGMH